MPFLRTTNQNLRDVVREFNESHLPAAIPDVPTSSGEVLGHDANLPLLIREMAPVQLKNLRTERDRLNKRLLELEEKERTLTALLDLVNG